MPVGLPRWLSSIRASAWPVEAPGLIYDYPSNANVPRLSLSLL